MRRSLRPQLSLKILLFALVDVFGMVLLASAAMWLAREQTLFIPGLPRSVGEAIAMGIIGLSVMIWAVAQILKELIRRPPDHV